MNELEEIMNGKQEMRCFRIEGDTIGFDTLKSANWNLTPRDIEMIIYTLQEDKKNLQSKIDKINELIKIEKEKMGYAKYDSCLLLIENVLKEDK